MLILFEKNLFLWSYTFSESGMSPDPNRIYAIAIKMPENIKQAVFLAWLITAEDLYKIYQALLNHYEIYYD